MFISEAFAQTAPVAAPGGIIEFLTPLVVVIAIFYMLVWRPQGKRMREHEEMVRSLSAGDKVITTGGIHATVVKTDEDKAVLTIAKGVDITLNLNSVTMLVEKATAKPKKVAVKKTKKTTKKTKKAA